MEEKHLSGIFTFLMKRFTTNNWLFRISSFWKKISIRPIIYKTLESEKNKCDKQDIIKFAGWLLSRGDPSLITHVVAILNSNYEVTPASSAVINYPYITDKSEIEARKAIFQGYPVITGDYVNIPNTTPSSWNELFISLNSLGPITLTEKVVETISVLPDYNTAKHTACNYLGINYDELKDTHTTIAAGWKIWDTLFPVQLNQSNKEYIRIWLQSNMEILASAKNCIYLEGYNRRSFYAYGKPGSANWVKQLSELDWIEYDGQWFYPEGISKKNASQTITDKLSNILEKQGLTFKQD